MPEFMTPTEFAQLLRVRKERVYEQLRAGEIPAVRIGRLYRIRTEAALEQLSVCQDNPHPQVRDPRGGGELSAEEAFLHHFA